MADSGLHTTQLQGWLERMRDGDRAARDELLRAVCGRLEQMARAMLSRFPNVRRWAETGDVLQNALMRLLRSLEKVEIDSTRAFFGLAAEHIRRELLDLARHYYGREGVGANHASHAALPAEAPQGPDPADRTVAPDDLERWCNFHQAVAGLPTEEREVVGLVFYHHWSQAQVAELLQVSERTVRRYWQSALRKLHHLLRDAGGLGAVSA
jgi:RNA polymerase sigma-70 factor (ECF subfamily)